MPDAASFAFHFLRPWWLMALAPTVLFLWQILRRDAGNANRHAGIIAPHLRDHLLVGQHDRRWLRPAHLMAAILVLGILGAAGPTWRREAPPFVEDKAPLVVALDVSSSMANTDVKPSRLERAKQKIRDLLKARAGARTGLVAYAGTAHLVMPPTDDPAVIEPFLAALAINVMPVEGKNASAALALADQLLSKEPVPGTVLVLTDSLAPGDWNAVAGQAGGRRNEVVLLAMVPGGDTATITAGIDVPVVRVTVDEADIRAVERRIATHFQAAQAQDPSAQWRDEGYWLLLPATLLALLWFRRGWTVQWGVALLLVATPTHADASWFTDLWLTRDQQGRIAFDRGDFAQAAKLFDDPYWKGVAAYRANDFWTAAEAFQTVDTRDGWFALGNAQARNHAWQKAIDAYEHILKTNPEDAAAKTNLAIVRAALEAQEKKRRQQEKDDDQPPDLPPDETKVDPEQKGGKRVEVRPEDVTTPGAAEAWMRQVQTSPADFLKVKFTQQAAAASGAPKEPPR